FQEFSKDFAGGKLGMGGGGHVQPDRTRELAVEIEAQQPHVVGLIIWVGEGLREARLDRAFAHVSAVAQAKNGLALARRYRGPAVDPVEKRGDPVGKRSLRLERTRRDRRHPEHLPREPGSPAEKVNRSLTRSQPMRRKTIYNRARS